MAFRIGQPVECIKEMSHIFAILFPDVTFPVLGSRYTIRGFINDSRGYEYLVVEEIVNRLVPYDGVLKEAAWPVTNFRALTDISALTKLTKVRELEDA